MLPYWLLFALWSVGAVQSERRTTNTRSLYLALFAGAAVYTALMIGLRFEVGGDWFNYANIYQDMYFVSLPGSWSLTDPGYASVNWLAAQGGLGVVCVNLVCATLFMAGLARLAWQQPNPALAMLVAVPYLIIVVAMGYTRQAAAIGIICLAIADASERRLIRMVVLFGLATLFHKTALLVLPIALLSVLRRNLLFGIFGATLFAMLFLVFLSDTSDRLIANYVQSDYNSQGALIRVLMNVISALLFLYFRKSIEISPFQKSFWLACSVLSLISVMALAIASASSGIDRISLYLIPLQVVALSRLPYLAGGRGRATPSVLIGVLSYSFLVQFIWLNYADNSQSWLPYQVAGTRNDRPS